MTDSSRIPTWRFASSPRSTEHLIDALEDASSPILHRRDGETTLWSMDITDILRAFARECALDAIKVSGLEVPPIVMEYLTTGAESLREAAMVAASDAARIAARDAAMNATGEAAMNAAWEAAWDAAMVAAMVAARDAAMVAARDAEWEAAWDAAMNAAWDAAMDAAWDAARKATREAAMNAAWCARGRMRGMPR